MRTDDKDTSGEKAKYVSIRAAFVASDWSFIRISTHFVYVVNICANFE